MNNFTNNNNSSNNTKSSTNEKWSSLRSNQNADYSPEMDSLWCIRKYENFFFLLYLNDRKNVPNETRSWKFFIRMIAKCVFCEKSFKPKKLSERWKILTKSKEFVSWEMIAMHTLSYPVFGLWSCAFLVNFAWKIFVWDWKTKKQKISFVFRMLHARGSNKEKPFPPSLSKKRFLSNIKAASLCSAQRMFALGL